MTPKPSLDAKAERPMSRDDFLAWEAASRDTIDVKRAYIDLAQDLVAGVVLSQIVYWHLPAKDNRTKLRVHDGESFRLAKNHGDWWAECRISPKQAAKALNRLKDSGLVEVRNGMFNAKRTPFISLCWKPFLAQLNRVVSEQYANEPQTAVSVSTKRRYRSYRKVDTDHDKRSRPITETTVKDHDIRLPSKSSEGGNELVRLKSRRARAVAS